MVINPIVGVYIPIIRIPIKGGMTIPYIAFFCFKTSGVYLSLRPHDILWVGRWALSMLNVERVYIDLVMSIGHGKFHFLPLVL